MARVIVKCEGKAKLQFAEPPETYEILLSEISLGYSLDPESIELTYSDSGTEGIMVYSESSYSSAVRLSPKELVLTVSVQTQVYPDLGDVSNSSVAQVVELDANGITHVAYQNGTQYEGYMTNGLFDRRGVLLTSRGIRYEGDFLHGKCHGRGKMTWPSGMIYDGDWDTNMMHGRGYYKLSSGIVYEGEMQNNKYNGRGTMVWPNGNRYEGEWKLGKIHGRGVLSLAIGVRHEGTWAYGKYDGPGRFYSADGKMYEGMWRSGYRHGPGILLYPDGKRVALNYDNGQVVKYVCV